jgi:NADH:ubiquinone oxidoreductase subunit K
MQAVNTTAKPFIKYILTIVSILSCSSIFILKPIPQPVAYHHFADIRSIFSIANFWNVISNVLFFCIGWIGIIKLRKNKLAIFAALKPAYYTFFIGVMLVAFGSAWYHYNPNNITLVWDRLPMTIAFMSLLSFALAEFVDITLGKKLLLPFLFVGIFSIGYWLYGELHGNGDLRLYALVQFLPILLLVLMLVFGNKNYSSNWGYWALFVLYFIAKLAEHFDATIFNLSSGLIAGHFLKHLLSAVGLWLFLAYLGDRQLQ